MPPVHLNDLLFSDRDVGFGRRIAGLSEPESGPAADNRVSDVGWVLDPAAWGVPGFITVPRVVAPAIARCPLET